ncbi:MAG: hypothetical protein QOE70_3138 [Chthoniobacter sp.]|jgi:uncharacterized membrane protein|nr:hypothetical protein [Chthoniobacter sp.]
MTEPIPPSPDASLPDSNAPDSSAPDSGTTGLSRNVAAGLACLFSLLGGIVFLVLEKKDQFVRFWSMQAVFLGGLAVVVAVFVQFAGLIFSNIPVIGTLVGWLLWLIHLVFGLAWFAVYAITVVKSFADEEWEIPWLGKLARKQLAQLDSRLPPPAAPAP